MDRIQPFVYLDEAQLDVRMIDVPLQDVLDDRVADPLSLEKFEAFCSSRYVDDILYFNFLVSRLHAEGPTAKDLGFKCHVVHHHFIAVGAAYEVNLPDSIRQPCTEEYYALAREKNRMPGQNAALVHVFDKARKHCLELLDRDVYAEFKADVRSSLRVACTRKLALWWKPSNIKRMTLSKFFQFPETMDIVDFRIHNTVTTVFISLALIFEGLKLYPGPLVIYCIMLYGFFMRLLSGPKIDPQAFLVLFVLEPLVERILKPKHEFGPGSPKRFAQLIGTSFSLTLLVLYITARHIQTARYVLLGVFFTAVFSAAAFGFCAGCTMYYFFQRLGIVTTDCAQCRAQACTFHCDAEAGESDINSLNLLKLAKVRRAAMRRRKDFRANIRPSMVNSVSWDVVRLELDRGALSQTTTLSNASYTDDTATLHEPEKCSVISRQDVKVLSDEDELIS